MLKNELFIVVPQKEYYSYDVITGYAELHLPYPYKTTGVVMDFLGQEVVDINIKNKNYKEVNPFVSLNMILTGPGSKDRGKTLLGARKKIVEEIPAGIHRYPFSFKLPGYLPCCFKTAFGRIEYFIRVTLEPGEKQGFPLVSITNLQIGGSLFDLNYIGSLSVSVQQMESKSFFMTKGTLDCCMSLESKAFLAGDTIRARIDINNKTNKTMEQTKLHLIQRVEYYVGNQLIKDDNNELAVINIGTVNPKYESHPAFEIIIPTTSPESVIELQQARAKIGKNVRISYKIGLCGNVKGSADINVEIPIIVVRRGAKQNPDPRVISTSAVSAPSLGASAPPPGYYPPQQAQPPPQQQQIQLLPPQQGPTQNIVAQPPPQQQQIQQLPPQQGQTQNIAAQQHLYPSIPEVYVPPTSQPQMDIKFDFSSIPTFTVDYASEDSGTNTGNN